MFEDELNAYLASKVADGTILRGDLTGVNETALVGEAIVIVHNAAANQDREKYIFLYKENGVIKYNVLKKQADPLHVLTAQQSSLVTTTSQTPVPVDGLSFPVDAGCRYHFSFMGSYRSSTLTTGVGFTFTSPVVTKDAWMLTVQTTKTGTSQMLFGSADSVNTAITSTSVAVINTDYIWKAEGYFTAVEEGTLQLCFKSEVEGSEIGILNVGVGVLTLIE